MATSETKLDPDQLRQIIAAILTVAVVGQTGTTPTSAADRFVEVLQQVQGKLPFRR